MWLKFTQKDNRLLGSNKRIHMPRSVSSVLFPAWEERGGLVESGWSPEIQERDVEKGEEDTAIHQFKADLEPSEDRYTSM